MPFYQSAKIRYYQFESFQEKYQKVIHGIFTRHGGISPEPWASLNVGGTVGDLKERVEVNKQRIFKEIGRDIESLYEVWQVHGNEVICTDKARNSKAPFEKADAILTNQQGITLMMRFADCVPILLWDPTKKVIAIVHAGWQGTINKIILKTINAMKENYGSKSANILAGIGPAICKKHYEVGTNVISLVKTAFGSDSSGLLTQTEFNKDGSMQFDLIESNCLLLRQAGVKYIELSGLCTYCNVYDWYSHRKENNLTGRFGVIIGL